MNLMPPICLANTLTTVLTINMLQTLYLVLLQFILLYQVFSTLPAKGQVSEVVS